MENHLIQQWRNVDDTTEPVFYHAPCNLSAAKIGSLQMNIYYLLPFISVLLHKLRTNWSAIPALLIRKSILPKVPSTPSIIDTHPPGKYRPGDPLYSPSFSISCRTLSARTILKMINSYFGSLPCHGEANCPQYPGFLLLPVLSCLLRTFFSISRIRPPGLIEKGRISSVANWNHIPYGLMNSPLPQQHSFSAGYPRKTSF